MKSLSRLLSPERILWLDQTGKNDCLRALVDCISSTTAVERPDDVYHAILERERLLSTGFGLGLAIPHAKLKGIEDKVDGFVFLTSHYVELRRKLHDWKERTDSKPADLRWDWEFLFRRVASAAHPEDD